MCCSITASLALIMSNIEQMEDSLSYMKEFRKLTATQKSQDEAKQEVLAWMKKLSYVE